MMYQKVRLRKLNQGLIGAWKKICASAFWLNVIVIFGVKGRVYNMRRNSESPSSAAAVSSAAYAGM